MNVYVNKYVSHVYIVYICIFYARTYNQIYIIRILVYIYTYIQIQIYSYVHNVIMYKTYMIYISSYMLHVHVCEYIYNI